MTDASAPDAPALEEMLDVEELDRDLFRAPGRPTGLGTHLFGGQVAAQCLVAAQRTVDPERTAHSLHSYFLRPGNIELDVILQVHRDRDGGSFSARRVVAIQQGEVIFSLSASFHKEVDSGEYQLPMPEVPDPDEVPDSSFGGGPPIYFETKSLAFDQPGEFKPPHRLWIKSRNPMSDDAGAHAAALAYVSDYGSGFGDLDVPNVAKAGPSIDHTVWFHRPIRLDDWVLVDMWPLRASGERGTYLGTVHAQDGTLGAVFAQEALLRPGRVPPPEVLRQLDEDARRAL